MVASEVYSYDLHLERVNNACNFAFCFAASLFSTELDRQRGSVSFISTERPFSAMFSLESVRQIPRHLQ